VTPNLNFSKNGQNNLQGVPLVCSEKKQLKNIVYKNCWRSFTKKLISREDYNKFDEGRFSGMFKVQYIFFLHLIMLRNLLFYLHKLKQMYMLLIFPKK
jgi:hypothetical protein